MTSVKKERLRCGRQLSESSACSTESQLRQTWRRSGEQPRTLRTAHGGAYELGMREHDHGVPIAPFLDGEQVSVDSTLTPIKTTHSPT